MDFIIHRKIIDTDGSYIILHLTVNNEKITLTNLYGPNNDNPQFFQMILDYIDEIGNSEVITCGD